MSWEDEVHSHLGFSKVITAVVNSRLFRRYMADGLLEGFAVETRILAVNAVRRAKIPNADQRASRVKQGALRTCNHHGIIT
ncbi:hypothetical protein CF98_07585 [Halopseudomonas bauzanensis]|nr:hypothetical protein CF98_07585 [Halopseudomonas bauzanensis]